MSIWTKGERVQGTSERCLFRKLSLFLVLMISKIPGLEHCERNAIVKAQALSAADRKISP